MNCPTCGTQITPGNKFCRACGTAVPLPIAGVVANAAASANAAPSASGPLRRNIIAGIAGVVAAMGAGLAYLSRSSLPFGTPPTETPRPTTAPVATSTPPPPPPTVAPVAPTSTIGSRRLIVDASDRGQFQTITAAVQAATPQDTVVIRPGVYRESVRVEKDINIVSEGGRTKVFVEGIDLEEAFDFRSGSASLTGITARYVGPKHPELGVGAITVRGGTPVIEDCDFTTSAGAAVYVSGSTSHPILRNCILHDSTTAGISFFSQGSGTIEGCSISGNATAGIWAEGGGTVSVRDSQIRDCKTYGVHIHDHARGTFIGNTLSGNGMGAWFIGPDAGQVSRTGNKPNA